MALSPPKIGQHHLTHSYSPSSFCLVAISAFKNAKDSKGPASDKAAYQARLLLQDGDQLMPATALAVHPWAARPSHSPC